MQIRGSVLFCQPNPSIRRYFRSNPDPCYLRTFPRCKYNILGYAIIQIYLFSLSCIVPLLVFARVALEYEKIKIIQGHPTTIFCKIYVRRSKNFLEILIAQERLNISSWRAVPLMYDFRTLSIACSTTFGIQVCH